MGVVLMTVHEMFVCPHCRKQVGCVAIRTVEIAGRLYTDRREVECGACGRWIGNAAVDMSYWDLLTPAIRPNLRDVLGGEVDMSYWATPAPVAPPAPEPRPGMIRRFLKRFGTGG